MKNVFMMAVVTGFAVPMLLMSGTASGRNPNDDAANEKVKALFESMEKGEYRDGDFPRLDQSDIPALLKFADSTVILKTFPRSPASSQYEKSCSEGMVALWLIEGIRKGGKYPSLNSLCFKGPVRGSNWTKASEDNHVVVAKAYRAWWEKVKNLTAKEASEVDPLKDTGMSWH